MAYPKELYRQTASNRLNDLKKELEAFKHTCINRIHSWVSYNYPASQLGTTTIKLKAKELKIEGFGFRATKLVVSKHHIVVHYKTGFLDKRDNLFAWVGSSYENIDHLDCSHALECLAHIADQLELTINVDMWKQSNKTSTTE